MGPGGGRLCQRRSPTYYLVNFHRKLHENIWSMDGTLSPPPQIRYSVLCVQKIVMFVSRREICHYLSGHLIVKQSSLKRSRSSLDN